MSRSHHGKHRQRRPGVHKNQHSPATKVWNTEHLIPEKPDWMTPATYEKLAKLRGDL